jgi:hypothetical protein
MALLVVAAAVAPTITNITTGTIRPFRWTAHVLSVISTIAVVKGTPLVVAPKITTAVAKR